MSYFFTELELMGIENVDFPLESVAQIGGMTRLYSDVGTTPWRKPQRESSVFKTVARITYHFLCEWDHWFRKTRLGVLKEKI